MEEAQEYTNFNVYGLTVPHNSMPTVQVIEKRCDEIYEEPGPDRHMVDGRDVITHRDTVRTVQVAEERYETVCRNAAPCEEECLESCVDFNKEESLKFVHADYQMMELKEEIGDEDLEADSSTGTSPVHKNNEESCTNITAITEDVTIVTPGHKEHEHTAAIGSVNLVDGTLGDEYAFSETYIDLTAEHPVDTKDDTVTSVENEVSVAVTGNTQYLEAYIDDNDTPPASQYRSLDGSKEQEMSEDKQGVNIVTVSSLKIQEEPTYSVMDISSTVACSVGEDTHEERRYEVVEELQYIERPTYVDDTLAPPPEQTDDSSEMKCTADEETRYEDEHSTSLEDDVPVDKSDVDNNASKHNIAGDVMSNASDTHVKQLVSQFKEVLDKHDTITIDILSDFLFPEILPNAIKVLSEYSHRSLTEIRYVLQVIMILVRRLMSQSEREDQKECEAADNCLKSICDIYIGNGFEEFAVALYSYLYSNTACQHEDQCKSLSYLQIIFIKAAVASKSVRNFLCTKDFIKMALEIISNNDFASGEALIWKQSIVLCNLLIKGEENSIDIFKDLRGKEILRAYIGHSDSNVRTVVCESVEHLLKTYDIDHLESVDVICLLLLWSRSVCIEKIGYADFSILQVEAHLTDLDKIGVIDGIPTDRTSIIHNIYVEFLRDYISAVKTPTQVSADQVDQMLNTAFNLMELLIENHPHKLALLMYILSELHKSFSNYRKDIVSKLVEHNFADAAVRILLRCSSGEVNNDPGVAYCLLYLLRLMWRGSCSTNHQFHESLCSDTCASALLNMMRDMGTDAKYSVFVESILHHIWNSMSRRKEFIACLQMQNASDVLIPFVRCERLEVRGVALKILDAVLSHNDAPKLEDTDVVQLFFNRLSLSIRKVADIERDSITWNPHTFLDDIADLKVEGTESVRSDYIKCFRMHLSHEESADEDHLNHLKEVLMTIANVTRVLVQNHVLHVSMLLNLMNAIYCSYPKYRIEMADYLAEVGHAEVLLDLLEKYRNDPNEVEFLAFAHIGLLWRYSTESSEKFRKVLCTETLAKNLLHITTITSLIKLKAFIDIAVVHIVQNCTSEKNFIPLLSKYNLWTIMQSMFVTADQALLASLAKLAYTVRKSCDIDDLPDDSVIILVATPVTLLIVKQYTLNVTDNCIKRLITGLSDCRCDNDVDVNKIFFTCLRVYIADCKTPGYSERSVKDIIDRCVLLIPIFLNNKSECLSVLLHILYELYLRYRSHGSEIGEYLSTTELSKTAVDIMMYCDENEWLLPSALLLSTLWNFSDICNKFCESLCTKNFLQLMVRNVAESDIQEGKGNLKDYLSKGSLSVIQNISKSKANFRDLFYELKVTDALFPFINHQDIHTKVVAIMALSRILSEEENKQFTDLGVVGYMSDMIKMAERSKDRRCEGFSITELVGGLANIAVSDNNKKEIVDNGLLPSLVNIMNYSDVEGQSVAAKTIWNLSFDTDVKRKLISEPGLQDALETLKQSEHHEVRKMASGALWKINEDSHKRSQEELVTNADEGHVFISYNWDHQQEVVKIKDALKAEGHKVWIDVEQMGGSTLDAMAKAVENAKLVLICLSAKYKQSPNCHTEAEYTFHLKKPIVPLMMQRYYKPDGWLGMMIGAKFYINFDGKFEFNHAFGMLKREILRYMQTGSVEDSTDAVIPRVSQPTTSGPPGAATHRPLKAMQDAAFVGWSVGQVSAWVEENQLQCGDVLDGVDGRALLRFCEMKREAPEFFYSYMTGSRGLGLLDVLRLADALLNLH